MRDEDDFGFIRNFLDRELAEKLELFVYEASAGLSDRARAFLATARASSPFALAGVAVARETLRELEAAHRSLITMHLEKDLKSVRVLREMRR